MPPQRRAAAAVAAGGLLAGLGGCHSGSGPSTRGATGTTATTTTAAGPTVTAPSALAGPACTMATAGLVGEQLGFTLTGPNVDRGPTATICTYDNPSNPAQSATVQFTDPATAASFATGRNGFASHGEVVTDVAGLGDQAYSATLAVANVTNTTLVARQGAIEVLINTTAPAARVPTLMAAILALV